ncbi:GNAT family N-acetyltransferase [Streptomyces cavernae]|uniref:GNAT family N-acetyltransferase n=1 Tax=Streptomyces cavernae TaxID=2259034 RepID=UPI001390E28D
MVEEGLWVPGTTRTSRQEVTSLTQANEITVAWLHDELVGCVRIQQLSDGFCEFGMLAAAPKRRGIGIGRELVRYAEQYGQEAGLDVSCSCLFRVSGRIPPRNSWPPGMNASATRWPAQVRSTSPIRSRLPAWPLLAIS